MQISVVDFQKRLGLSWRGMLAYSLRSMMRVRLDPRAEMGSTLSRLALAGRMALPWRS